jgi:hypothetical protein
VIDFSANAVDPDGTLSPSDYSWTVRFAHNDHHHPSLGPQTGQSGSFEIDSAGHDFTDDTGYELIVTVTDADGLTTTASVSIAPEKSDITVETVPAGLELVVDTLPRTAPFVLDTLIGFRHELVAQPLLCQSGTTYLFQGWSQGGSAVQTYVVPESDQTLTATYAVGGPCILPTTGIVLHLAASSGVQTNGSTVTQWSDLSGRGNHLVGLGQPQLVPGGLNGNDVIRFDGVDDRLERIGNLSALPAGSADRTVIVVANYLGNGVGGFSYGTTACNQTFGVVVNKVGNLLLQGWCSGKDNGTTTAGTGAGWLTQAAITSTATTSRLSSLAGARAEGARAAAPGALITASTRRRSSLARLSW